MKICLITRGLSLSWGGAEKVAVNLSMRLVENGHEVHVITSASDTQIKGVNIQKISVSRFFSPWKIISFQKKIQKIIRRQKFDIVYGLCQVYPVDIYRAGGGIQRHWMKIQYPNPAIRWIKYLTSIVHFAIRWLENQIFKEDNCRLFVTNSKLVKDQITYYFKMPEDRIKVIYNGVDFEIFNTGAKKYRNSMREMYNIAEDELVLLFVSNNWERKGLSTIIKAMSKTGIERSRLVVVGRGNRASYISLAKRLKMDCDKLIFAGHTKEAEKYYGMSDIFILPSRYDPFANVCLEAMACGLPVITTKTNGSSELIVARENGFILDDWEDSESLAGFIKILNDAGLRKAMGNNASKTAGSYTWERHIEETNNLFEMLSNNKTLQG